MSLNICKVELDLKIEHVTYSKIFFTMNPLIPQRVTNHFYPFCLTLRIITLYHLLPFKYFQIQVYNFKLELLNVLKA